MSSKGLAGITAADSTLSRVDGQKGELIYRGYNIMDLGDEGNCFEEARVPFMEWRAAHSIRGNWMPLSAALVAKRSLCQRPF